MNILIFFFTCFTNVFIGMVHFFFVLLFSSLREDMRGVLHVKLFTVCHWLVLTR